MYIYMWVCMFVYISVCVAPFLPLMEQSLYSY